MDTAQYRTASLALLTLALAGCGNLLPSITEHGGCQVRAGAVAPEGGSGIGPYAAIGGAATVVGVCPAEFRVYSHRNGETVCYGDADWCAAQMAAQPLDVTPAQLRELLTGGEAPE